SVVLSRSCSSESALTDSSSAFTCPTTGRSFFSSRSFWVPTTLARKVSSIRCAATWVSDDCNAHAMGEGRKAEGPEGKAGRCEAERNGWKVGRRRWEGRNCKGRSGRANVEGKSQGYGGWPRRAAVAAKASGGSAKASAERQ